MKSARRIRSGLLTLLGLLMVAARSSCAEISAEVVETIKIHESHKFGYFPYLQMLSTGELICDFSLEPDRHDVEGSSWAFVVSTDKGKTWGMRNTCGYFYRGEAAYTREPSLPDGSMLMLAGYPLPSAGDDYQNIIASSAVISNRGQTVLFSRDVRIHLPKPTVRQKMSDAVRTPHSFGPGKIKETACMFFSGTIVAGREGDWLTLMYGKLEGDEFWRTILVKADRTAKNWNYVSTIATDDAALEAVATEQETFNQGFPEPRVARLPDGRLFVVMRRGHNNMIYKSWSSDEGKNWSKPTSIGFRGVKPALTLMQNGLLALSTGRPDPISVRFSANGGLTWTEPTGVTKGLANPEGTKPQRMQKSTCYTGMVEVEPGRLLVVYDYLPFVEGWGLNPANEPTAMNCVYGTFVKVTHRP